MSIKISATTKEKFIKIEEALNKLEKDFLNKFSSAEYVVEGVINDVKLTTNCMFDDKIVLPINFVISEIKFNEYIEFNKRGEGELKEDKKYQIEINGKINEQGYKLIYTNLYKADKEITHR